MNTPYHLPKTAIRALFSRNSNKRYYKMKSLPKKEFLKVFFGRPSSEESFFPLPTYRATLLFLFGTTFLLLCWFFLSRFLLGYHLTSPPFLNNSAVTADTLRIIEEKLPK